MRASSWFSVRKNLPSKQRHVVSLLSFLLPITLWCLVSYIPVFWHPMIEVEQPGGVSYFKEGMLIDRHKFDEEKTKAISNDLQAPTGSRANPIYLPAPHEVVVAFYTSFTTEPKRRSEKWLHESLWESVQVIFWGFLLSSLIGVPLGLLAGTYDFFSRLFEPFIEFFRYLPAPAFGALAVAIMGIYQAPKIAIIFIGTFFQQVLVISNTTRKLDVSLLEAAQTLGATNKSLLFKVVVPGVLPELYRDMRILLGWAWTYLIVAELIGASSGITWFITQQARYKNFDNVFAAIMMIGIIGLAIDLLLGLIGRRLFPWQKADGTA
jgi:NitT/TauT family transport system permease protein